MLFNVCTSVIKSRDYNQEDMMRKIGKYKMANLITEQEYLDLVELIAEYPPKQA